MKKYLIFIFWVVCGKFAMAQTPAIWHVRPFANGQNDGTSWKDAFSSLQWALLMARPGDQVWLAQGVYRPSPRGDRSAYFEVRSGIQVLGGFRATDDQPTERDPVRYPTLIDGNLGDPFDSLDNSYCLMALRFPDENTLLDGLIFQKGMANKTPVSSLEIPGNSAAALYIDGTDSVAYPLIRNCIFRQNTASGSGAGVYIEAGSTGSVAPRFEDCRFEDNKAAGNGAAVYRGGSSIREMPGDFRRCVFYNNTATSYGGALYYRDANGQTDTLQMEDCVFEKNTAVRWGGAAFYTKGRINGGRIVVKGCRFAYNSSKLSGAFTFESEDNPPGYIIFDSVSFYRNQPLSTPTGLCCYESGLTIRTDNYFSTAPSGISLRKCTLEKNKGNNPMSVGVYCDVVIESCTFSDQRYPIAINANRISFKKNRVINNTGIIDMDTKRSKNAFIDGNIFMDNDSMWLRSLQSFFSNNLFYNNTVVDSSYEWTNPSKRDYYYNNIFVRNRNVALPEFNWALPLRNDSSYFYNNVFDFPDCVGMASAFVCGPGNIFVADPLLMDTAARDFRLSPCSPAIDAGLDQVLQQTWADGRDIQGEPRLKGVHVDIGPYEAPLPALADVSVRPACGDSTGGEVVFQTAHACLPLQYRWTRAGKTGIGNTRLEAGDYVFTVSDYWGTTWTREVQVPASPFPVVRDSVVAARCAGCATGRVSVQVQNGVVPYAFLWSNGSTTATIGDLLPGAYQLTLTDGNGCRFFYSYTVSFGSAVSEAGYLLPMLIQPNPVTDLLQVLWPASLSLQRLTLLDMTGRMAGSWEIASGQIGWVGSVEDLSQGVYICIGTDATGRTRAVGKIVKQ